MLSEGGKAVGYAYTISWINNILLRCFLLYSTSITNMKDYKTRVSFGSESYMIQAGGEKCSECGCNCEQLHIPGCAGEECPQCRKALIGCCCECLSPYDGEKIIQGIYRQFASLESALQAVGEEHCQAIPNSSYLQHAAMRYIFDNVPETAKTEISRAFHLRFPGLVPRMQDEEGRGYYTAEQLSEALDIPLSEVNERIDAMVTAGKGIAVAHGKKMRKIH